MGRMNALLLNTGRSQVDVISEGVQSGVSERAVVELGVWGLTHV